MRTLSFFQSLQGFCRRFSCGLKVDRFLLFDLRLTIEQVNVDHRLNDVLKVVQHVLRLECFQFIHRIVIAVALEKLVVIAGGLLGEVLRREVVLVDLLAVIPP